MTKLRFVVLALLATTAVARAQKFDDALASAVAAGKNDAKAAGKAFGMAAAIAHKTNDVLAEQRVAENLWPLLQTIAEAERAETLAQVALALNPKRAGAFVSAPTIAGELLMLATRAGDTAHAKEAAAILKAQSAAQNSGKAMRALSAYAKGMELVAGGKTAEAFAPFEEALKAAVAEGWADVAMCVGTELAARAGGAGDKEKAATALYTTGTLFKTDTDQDLVQTWRALVAKRLADAPPDVLAPYSEVMKLYKGPRSVSSAGGAGGAGGRAGALSPLGTAWKMLPPSKGFVSVRRIEEGFEVTAPFDPPLKLNRPLESGLNYASEGGLTLSFYGRGVALRMVDLTGGTGGPGATSSLPPGIPLYRLARGETWTVSKQGVVSISG